MQRCSTIAIAVMMIAPSAASAQAVCPSGDCSAAASAQAVCPSGDCSAAASTTPTAPLPEPSFRERNGWMIGVGAGVGGVQVGGQELSCASCGERPIASDAHVHIGSWIGEHSAMLLELQASAQTIESSETNTVRMIQGAALVAAQHWLTPRLWLKAGVGISTVANRFDDRTERVDSGLALMSSLGYEVFASNRHSIDLQARLTAGNYDWFGEVRAASVGLGLSWF